MVAERIARYLFFGAVLMACGGATESDNVTIGGVVYTDFHVNLPCAEMEQRPGMRPDELSGIVLKFSDAGARPLGSAATGPLRSQRIPDGCRFYAQYEVAIQPATGYRVEFDPPEPRRLPGGGYFDGANLLEPRSISHPDLIALGYAWSFEAPPAFVVP